MARRPLRLIAFFLACSFLLAGCAGRGPARLDIDTSIQAAGQDSRVKFVVLHYTAASRERSLSLLTGDTVSAHYLITDEAVPRVYRLVDEARNAWHAGDSSWRGRTWLNASSIGIEIVNAGPIATLDGTILWQPYSDAQIQTLTLLLRDIVDRHDIAPEDVVGHSDVAALRKQDPGPMFPWKQLAQAGLGRWYDEQGAALHYQRILQQGLPDVSWFQRELARVGYACPQTGQLDAATMQTLAAFQMHYRPAIHDGQPDAETAAILLALQ